MKKHFRTTILGWRTIWLVALPASCYCACAQPLIRPQPTSTVISLGGTVQFKVAAISTNPPIRYQWWFKEAALDTVANPSAATNVLSVTKVTPANGGPYFAVVSDTSGLAATSQVATLTVDPTFTKMTTNEVGQIVNDNAITWGVLLGRLRQ